MRAIGARLAPTAVYIAAAVAVSLLSSGVTYLTSRVMDLQTRVAIQEVQTGSLNGEILKLRSTTEKLSESVQALRLEIAQSGVRK